MLPFLDVDHGSAVPSAADHLGGKVGVTINLFCVRSAMSWDGKVVICPDQPARSRRAKEVVASDCEALADTSGRYQVHGNSISKLDSNTARQFSLLS